MRLRHLARHHVRVIPAWYRLSRAQLLIVSFPKSGRTWLQALIGKVLCDRLGLSDTQLLRTYQLTRRAGLPPVHVTHDGSAIEDGNRYHELTTDKRWYTTRRILLVLRDVRDVLVSSYFHATRRSRDYVGELSQFIRDERFGVDKVLRFQAGWYDNLYVPRDVMVVRYEDLHRQPARALTCVLRFIGLVSPDPDLVEAAVQFAEFRRLRRLEASGAIHQPSLQPGNRLDPESYKARRGVVGGYRTYLTDADVAFVNERIRASRVSFDRIPSLVPLSDWSRTDGPGPR